MPQITVRRAGPDDVGTLLSLVRALAEYEQLEPPGPEAAARLTRDAFGPEPRFQAYLADLDGEAVGYAIVFETYSSFLALPTLYLEDLFVLPAARRRGAGRALFRALAAEAVARGCGRMEWVVLDWNRLAQDFYCALGARQMDDWRFCRLADEPLRALGATAAGENPGA